MGRSKRGTSAKKNRKKASESRSKFLPLSPEDPDDVFKEESDTLPFTEAEPVRIGPFTNKRQLKILGWHDSVDIFENT